MGARKLEALEAASVEDLWEHDLKALSDVLDKLENQEAAREATVRPPRMASQHQGRKTASPTRPSSNGSAVQTLYNVGDKVEYFSKNANKWVAAVVLQVCDDGCYDLNIKRHAQPQNIRNDKDKALLKKTSSDLQMHAEMKCETPPVAATATEELPCGPLLHHVAANSSEQLESDVTPALPA